MGRSHGRPCRLASRAKASASPTPITRWRSPSSSSSTMYAGKVVAVHQRNSLADPHRHQAGISCSEHDALPPETDISSILTAGSTYPQAERERLSAGWAANDSRPEDRLAVVHPTAS